MTARIDERTAWDVIRAVPRDFEPRGTPASVPYHPKGDVRVQVHPSGAWSASPSPTTAARQLFDIYLPIRIHPEITIGQIGQSLDGRISTASGDSHYVTGQADLQRLHRLRALVDAVIVGARTVAADNPRLTVRAVEGDNPVRVVIDPEGQLAREYHVFTDGAVRTIEVRRGAAASPARLEPAPHGDILRLPATHGSAIDPVQIVHALNRQGLKRLLVEGGGVTVSRFVEAGILDRLHVTVAPLLIGSGRPSLTLRPISSLTEALRPSHRTFRLGDDILFDMDLRAGRF